MSDQVRGFYDRFSGTFVRDYVYGNRRVDWQLRFFKNAVPPSSSDILVIGCGSGQSAHYLATRVAKHSRVLGVDLSDENLRIANALFSHRRVEYRQLDVVRDRIEGKWQVVALPDVYEHLPRSGREVFHQALAALLTDTGRIVLTVPTPAAQQAVLRQGKSLQVIDEPVTLADLTAMATAINGHITYYNEVSVWEANDYAHAVIERGTGGCRALTPGDKLPLNGWPSARWMRSFAERLRVARCIGIVCRWVRVRCRLGRVSDTTNRDGPGRTKDTD